MVKVTNTWLAIKTARAVHHQILYLRRVYTIRAQVQNVWIAAKLATRVRNALTGMAHNIKLRMWLVTIAT